MGDVAVGGGVAPPVSRPDLPDLELTITGAPGADVASNPTVTVVERRWLAETRTGTEAEVKTATGTVRHVELGNGMCADETVFTVEVYRCEDQCTLRAYQDWRFDVPLADYLGWLNSDPMRPPVDIRGTLDAPMSLGPYGVDTFADRGFGTAPAAQLIGSGWLPVAQDSPPPSRQLVYTGVSYDLGKPYPCPEGTTTGVSDQAVVQVQVLDADTGQPIQGTVQTVGALMVMQGVAPGPTGPQSPATSIDSPMTVNQDDSSGLGVVVVVGREVTFTHTPQAGWETVRNSAGESPATAVHLTAQNPDGTYLVVFYDRPIRILDEGLPPPPPPAPPAQRSPSTEPQGSGTTPSGGEGTPGTSPSEAPPAPVEHPSGGESAPPPTSPPTPMPTSAPASASAHPTDPGSALAAFGWMWRETDRQGTARDPVVDPDDAAIGSDIGALPIPGSGLGLEGTSPPDEGGLIGGTSAAGPDQPGDVSFTTPAATPGVTVSIGETSPWGGGPGEVEVATPPPVTATPVTGEEAPSTEPALEPGPAGDPTLEPANEPQPQGDETHEPVLEPQPQGDQTHEPVLEPWSAGRPQGLRSSLEPSVLPRGDVLGPLPRSTTISDFFDWVADLGCMARIGCALGLLVAVTIASVGGYTLVHRTGSSTPATSSSGSQASAAELRIGPPVTGTETYRVTQGSQVFTRAETVALQTSGTAQVLSVDTVPASTTTAGSSCADYRKEITGTGVIRTQEILQSCTGAGSAVTVTCTPGMPLFMTTWTVGASQPFTEQCVPRSSASTGASVGPAWTDAGTAGLTKVSTIGGAQYVTVHRRYARTFASTNPSLPTTTPATLFDEVSVYGLGRWQEIGTVTTTSVAVPGGLQTSTSSWELQGAPVAVLALLPAPTATQGTPASQAPFSAVTIPFNELSFGTSFADAQAVCQLGGTLHLRVTILGITPGTPVQIRLSGPGVPSSLTFRANPGERFGQDFNIRGAGVWSDDIVSIGGQPPPSAGSHVSAPLAC